MLTLKSILQTNILLNVRCMCWCLSIIVRTNSFLNKQIRPFSVFFCKDDTPVRVIQFNVCNFPYRVHHLVQASDWVFACTKNFISAKLFSSLSYEGWNFNSGNYLFTTDTKQIHVSKFYCPSLQSPALCTTRFQRCGSRRIPLAASVVLIVRMERSTA